MAHVLLPCDMPSWIDVQRHLSHLRLARNPDELIAGMQKIYGICSINLDPDEMANSSDPLRFEAFRSYLTDLPETDRAKFFKVILPNLVNNAVRLKLLKSLDGFQFSLQQEDKMICMDRKFAASLIANAFFSTFPKRTHKTHPTLQDFNFGDFFVHLKRPEQQQKLRYFLYYFEVMDAEEPIGNIKFYRQSLRPTLNLPSWLCSERPLCPLVVRTMGTSEQAESSIYRTCFCSSRLGGEVLKNGTNMESINFSRMPELIATMSFVECLCENEALIAEGIINIKENALNSLSTEEVDVCLMDAKNYCKHPSRQFEDRNLLRDMNKAFIAFSQPLSRCRPAPVGQSFSSSTCPEFRNHSESPPVAPTQDMGILITSEMLSLNEVVNEKKCIAKQFAEPTKTVKVSSKSNQSNKLSGEIGKHVYIPSTSSVTSQNSEYMDTVESLSRKGSSIAQRPLALMKTGSKRVSTEKIPRRQRSRSVGAIPSEISLEEEYFTASESFEEYDGILKLKYKFKGVSKRDYFDASFRQISDDSRYSRSDSIGFVLDGASEDEDSMPFLSKHERYEDFRKRIRRRSRRLSKKGSRSSWLSSSGSSDMEDILEDSELSAGSLRQSNSEPSLFSPSIEENVFFPPISLPLDTVSMSLGKKKVMVTASNGQLKAYSYDGVKPNLPVPFKAKFRTRRESAGSDEEMFHSLRDPPSLWKESSSEEGSLKDAKEDIFEQKSSSFSSILSENKSLRDFLITNSDGIRAVATGNWGYEQQNCDVQLKAIIQWLAASMAKLPCLVYYTEGDAQLTKLEKVIKRCQKLEWKLGDLACETLRYCRNRLSGKGGNGRSTSIFTQLLAGDTFLSQDSLE
ncbi:uncharacterized protein [Centruroides vittatus]|uniref:uncharacterized protein n=1 Tax=Centruroides vittatus TaxID=120091 RepID=UPI00351052A5